MRKLLVLFIAVIPLSGNLMLFAQEPVKFNQDYIINPYEKELNTEADFLFSEGNFLRALNVYKKLYELFPGGTFYRYKLGICYLYKSDEKYKALEHLEAVQKAGEEDPELLFYLGRAYHLNSKFDEAIEAFNAYINEEPLGKNIKEARLHIGYCNNAKSFTQKPLPVLLQNIESPVNTPNSEYVPVISSDESMLIYTYRGERSIGGLMNSKFEPDTVGGEFYEDIFISYKNGNTWTFPEPIENINTLGHDAAIAISPDGQKLFIYKSTVKDGGDIYMSTLNGKSWSVPARLDGDVNSKYWEGSASLSANGRVLYFSSDRPGGVGGKDIYKAELNDQGVWTSVKNLGPSVNTPHDEDAPFIHPDGKLLHFSSKGHNSMGGYDIFVTRFDDKGNNSRPENLGYPINTTDDDVFYVLNAEGTVGYYSSNRVTGYGQQDIYAVNPGVHGKKPVIMLVKGKVTVNGSPAEASITVKVKGRERVEGQYRSNSLTGKYLVTLPAGYDYSLSYEAAGFPVHLEQVQAAKIDSFTEKIIDVPFGKETVIAKVDSVSKDPVGKKQLKIQRVFFGFDEYDLERDYQAYADNVYAILKEHKGFRVQITGHTDNLGTDEYNYNLSRRRANTLAEYLVAKGIERSRIVIGYKGESNPIAVNQNPDGSDNPDGRAKNRRVEFIINTGTEKIDIIYEDNSPSRELITAQQMPSSAVVE
jgi:outer membrane protein OmpA-like peptidoglycan-associated protein/Tol biopolymer transport system component